MACVMQWITTRRKRKRNSCLMPVSGSRQLCSAALNVPDPCGCRLKSILRSGNTGEHCGRHVQEYGREPSAKAMAALLGVGREEIDSLAELARSAQSQSPERVHHRRREPDALKDSAGPPGKIWKGTQSVRKTIGA